VFVFIAV